MKKVLIISMFVALIVCASAQEINSFRYLSTGGALDGEVEYAFDPIDLQLLKGLRFYSALSNFSETDQILDNQGTNSLLLGFSSDESFLKNLKSSMLFQYQKEELPLSYQYYTNPFAGYSSTGYGEGEYNWQSYYDTNGNELYDRYLQVIQKYKMLEYDESMNLFLVLAYPINKKLSLGLKSGYSGMNTGHSYASKDILYFDSGDPSSEYLETSTTLPEMDPTVELWTSMEDVKGDFKTEYDLALFHNQLAANLKKGKWDVSGYYSLDILNLKMDTLDKASSWEMDDGMLRSETMMEQNTRLTDIDELINKLNARFRYMLAPADDFTLAGYLSFALGAGFGAGSMDTETSNAQEMRSTTLYAKANQLIREASDGNSLIFDANARLSLPLNRSTIIGTGIFFALENSDQEGTYSSVYTARDSVFQSWDNQLISTSIRSSRSFGKLENEYKYTSIRVPFGLEYWFTKNMKWALRFGSSFEQTTQIDKAYYTPTLIEPTTTEITYPNGDMEFYMSDNEAMMENTRRKTTASSSNFSYGLCFKPSKNLTIELISMFEDTNADFLNASFLRSLKLSFSFCR